MNIKKEIVIHLNAYSGGDMVSTMADFFNITEKLLLKHMEELALQDVLFVDECDTGLYACLIGAE